MKTLNLSDSALDWAVAKCEGIENSCGMWVQNHWVGIPFSSSWTHGGPIIERENISTTGINFPWWECDGGWYAHIGDLYAYGSAPLIAAMRCYVASKLGDEVEIPEAMAQALATQGGKA